MYDKSRLDRFIREGRAKEPPMVHGAMVYCCNKCKAVWYMWLEIGVEDHGGNGRPHQPCPFVICCDCGGNAQDVSGYVPCREVFQLDVDGARYFAYDHSGSERACGRPRVYRKLGGDGDD